MPSKTSSRPPLVYSAAMKRGYSRAPGLPVTTLTRLLALTLGDDDEEDVKGKGGKDSGRHTYGHNASVSVRGDKKGGKDSGRYLPDLNAFVFAALGDDKGGKDTGKHTKLFYLGGDNGGKDPGKSADDLINMILACGPPSSTQPPKGDQGGKDSSGRHFHTFNALYV